MIFEIGKQYIVSVTANKIIPIEEFSEDRYFDIEHDSIDFLTDEEKMVIINDVLDKIRTEIEGMDYLDIEDGSDGYDNYIDRYDVLQIIDKYREEVEEGKE